MVLTLIIGFALFVSVASIVDMERQLKKYDEEMKKKEENS